MAEETTLPRWDINWLPLRHLWAAGPPFVAEYEDLLSRTGMATPAELAHGFGIDLRSPAFWRAGLDMVRERIERFEELCAVK